MVRQRNALDNQQDHQARDRLPGRDTQPLVLTVDGEDYVRLDDALEAIASATPSRLPHHGVYDRLRKLVDAGRIRVVRLDATRRLYHRGDLARLQSDGQ